ncbi:MAG: hypothetical protein V4495_21440, partial [Pseudomonadota bacterium]
MNDRFTLLDVMLFLILLLTCPIWLACMLMVWIFTIACFNLIGLNLPLNISLVLTNMMTLIGLPFFFIGYLGSTGFFHLMRKRPQVGKNGFTYRQWFSSREISWAEVAFIKWTNHIPDGDAFEFTLVDGSVLSFNSYVKIQYLLEEAQKVGVEFRRWDRPNKPAVREKIW